MDSTVILGLIGLANVLLMGVLAAIGILWRSTEKSHAAVALSLKTCEEDRQSGLKKIDQLRDEIILALQKRADANAAANADNSARATANDERMNASDERQTVGDKRQDVSEAKAKAVADKADKTKKL